MNLTLIIPCYNEEENIKPFYEKCLATFFKETFNVNYIFINDGSKDNTLNEIKKLILNEKKSNIYCLNFSRNFGKEAAMFAGMQKSQKLNTQYTVIIDADLQQDPIYIVKMYEFIHSNPDYDCVTCYQEKRKEGKILSFFKNTFYKIINKISEVPFYQNASDFRLINQKMLNALLQMTEYYRFSKGIFSWVGFNTYYMPYEVNKRIHGQSSWSILSLFRYAINGIIGFSTIPLKLATFTGTISFLASIIYGIIIIIQKLTVGIDIAGYPTIVCLILFIGGIQMILLGIIGEYLGKTYIETKKRPIYLIKDDLSFQSIGETNDEKNN